ncbi:MmpL3/TtfA transport complex stabilizer [Mycolicibacterium neworleansense]|uniref:YVTN family beta-propeller repeat protein n=1 Tax=Mycolicibacterium neworleansense TaxID=146018 RepID=A0A0H5RWT7_9MYCO|nr:YncE family protein [Mycolicibacterium neworleansense]MCV7361226.1 YncE family protein [Mycolicibacterium neworleansense]CRZ18373.1 YVTN family beta-propeller repeat protein [Mycolicibacterium neworleansense]
MANNFLRALTEALRSGRNDRAIADTAVRSVAFDGALDDIDVAGLAEVGRGPIGDIAVDPERETVVVTNAAAQSLTVINPHTMGVVGSVRLAGDPFAVVVADDRAYVSVSAAGHDSIVTVDTITGAVLNEYPLAFSVTALAISPDGKRVFAGRSGHERIDIAVIDTTAERVGTIDIATGAGVNLDALQIDSSGKRLYVATSDFRGSRLVVVNTETAQAQATVWIGAPIRDIAIGDGVAYVLTSDLEHRGVVHTVDLAAGAVVDAVEVGGAPTQLVLSPDATRAYLVDYDRVIVWCALSSQIQGTVDVHAQPAAVVLRDNGTRLYIADYAGQVNVFDVAESLYSQLVSVDAVELQELPALQPAGA